MADVQVADRVFQRGADAVVMGVRFVGRDKVGDVPDDEQIAGRRVKEQDRVNPGVAAGDDEGVGMLADAEVFIILFSGQYHVFWKRWNPAEKRLSRSCDTI